MNYYENLQEHIKTKKLKVPEFHSSLKEVLAAIKRAVEKIDLEVFEADIRRVGERGVQPMKSLSDAIRARDQKENEFVKIVFRVHRSPSEVYIVDFCNLQNF